jgi:hypothetical protein
MKRAAIITALFALALVIPGPVFEEEGEDCSDDVENNAPLPNICETMGNVQVERINDEILDKCGPTP